MTKLTNSVALLTRANKAARLIAIDTDAKTCIIYGESEKTVTWATATSYKLDTGTEKTKILTPKLLIALCEAEQVHQSPEGSTVTDATAPVSEPESSAPAETPESAESVVQATQEGAGEAPAKPTADKPEKAVKINANEKLLLATIPKLPDFKGVDSVMDGRNFLKKAEELNGVPLGKGCNLFGVLRDKGFYSAKGRKEGQNRTTFQLSDKGVQYLTENGLLAVV